jgi:CDGSH-type Zn-finger protein
MHPRTLFDPDAAGQARDSVMAGRSAALTLPCLRADKGLIEAMRRIVKSDRKPLEIKPQGESVWICMCGLSKNQPLCDGSHKTTRDEEDGKTYEYDAEGHRHEV